MQWIRSREGCQAVHTCKTIFYFLIQTVHSVPTMCLCSVVVNLYSFSATPI